MIEVQSKEASQESKLGRASFVQQEPLLGMVQVRLTLSQDALWRGGTKWPETIGFAQFSGEKWLF